MKLHRRDLILETDHKKEFFMKAGILDNKQRIEKKENREI